MGDISNVNELNVVPLNQSNTEIKLKEDYIQIKNPNGNNVILIGTNNSNNGIIEIKKDDGTNILTLDNNKLSLNGIFETNNKMFILDDKHSFASNRKYKYTIPNKNYIDKKFRTDYEDKYWRTVSTKLTSFNKDEEYPVRIKEFIIKNKIPMRYSFDLIQTKKGIHPLTNKEYSYNKFSTYPGSLLKVGTNKNWSFCFTKAKKKTINKSGKLEYLYDNNNNVIYETPLVVENIKL